MIFAALSEAAQRGELILREDGMCRFHRRKDGVVVIHEILVQPWAWKQGIGRKLVDEVRAKNPGCPIRARCPRSYESNGFWVTLGFTVEKYEETCNVWRLDPPSATAPTATLPLPVLPS